VSLVIGKHYVLSFDEGRGQVFEPVREKLRKYKGRIRKMGSDYLVYRLLDAVVDTYFALLEKLGEKLESLEERVVTDPTPEVMREIHALRIDMTVFYRSVWPLREVVGALTRDDLPVIRKATEAYFRDVYDHTVQIIETMETDRDMVSGMLDIYVSSVSNKMNEIMKVLTVIATIFIPMTFLAGVWGMNFRYMPELDLHWAYPAFWGLMIAVAVFMLIYFRRRKWL
jgi:magnesium transporter